MASSSTSTPPTPSSEAQAQRSSSSETFEQQWRASELRRLVQEGACSPSLSLTISWISLTDSALTFCLHPMAIQVFLTIPLIYVPQLTDSYSTCHLQLHSLPTIAPFSPKSNVKFLLYHFRTQINPQITTTNSSEKSNATLKELSALSRGLESHLRWIRKANASRRTTFYGRGYVYSTISIVKWRVDCPGQLGQQNLTLKNPTRTLLQLQHHRFRLLLSTYLLPSIPLP